VAFLTTTSGFTLPRVRAHTATLDKLTLVYWNETLNDWATDGLYPDLECMAASDDVCTFCGYSLHLTTFALGSIVINLNTIDPAKVRTRPSPLKHFVHDANVVGAGRWRGVPLRRTRRGCCTWARHVVAS